LPAIGIQQAAPPSRLPVAHPSENSSAVNASTATSAARPQGWKLAWRLPLHWLWNVIRSVVISLTVLGLLLLRPLKFLYPLFPRGLRETLRAWDYHMLWTTLRSFGRRIYVDQPCTLRDPPSYEPRVQTDPRYALSAADIRKFYEQGFLGPFDAFTPEEVASFREEVRQVIHSPSQVYGFVTGRDRHLDSPVLDRIMRHPAMVERLAQILGPDLMVWRSQVFEKAGGSREIAWHQGTTFLMEMVYKPALEPPDINELFEVAIWLAIDDATRENGCIQFVPGSHRRIGTVLLTGSEAFHGARIRPEYRIDPRDVVTPECRAGQFLIFSERAIHGSPPNDSRRSRMAFVYRALRPDVRVYRGEKRHRVAYYKQWFDLEKWGAVMLRGEDRYGINKFVAPPSASAAPPKKMATT
jgi:non-heme Fe2+,alpha-ketoglutarate-dependent halogenase